MKIIPSFKLSISYKQLNRVLQRLLFGGASEQSTSEFELKFAQYLGVKYAIRVPSGRWGLYYILQNLNLNKGDEVILPAFTYFAVPAVIVKLGLKPVFVDIDKRGLSMDIQKIEESITKKTRIIIPTYLSGFACGITEILKIAQKHNIIIIEDCAQALGAEYNGKMLGSWGTAAYFTFGITKNFTTLGGGMIVTNSRELENSIRGIIKKIYPTRAKTLFLKLIKACIIKNATSPIVFPVIYAGIRLFSCLSIDIIDRIFHEKVSLLDNLPDSGQLNSIQSELGILQLNGLDIKNRLRIQNGMELYGRIRDVANIQIPLLENNAKNIFSSFPVLVKNKEIIKKMLLKQGIDASSGYMQDCSRIKIFEEFRRSCPEASKREEEMLHLPMYPELSYSELVHIAETITQAVLQTYK